MSPPRPQPRARAACLPIRTATPATRVTTRVARATPRATTATRPARDTPRRVRASRSTEALASPETIHERRRVELLPWHGGSVRDVVLVELDEKIGELAPHGRL